MKRTIVFVFAFILGVLGASYGAQAITTTPPHHPQETGGPKVRLVHVQQCNPNGTSESNLRCQWKSSGAREGTGIEVQWIEKRLAHDPIPLPTGQEFTVSINGHSYVLQHFTSDYTYVHDPTTNRGHFENGLGQAVFT